MEKALRWANQYEGAGILLLNCSLADIVVCTSIKDTSVKDVGTV